ncbi:hypothetical protein EJ04DRAFT_571330, partial [Polyplosphaeria fusca]
MSNKTSMTEAGLKEIPMLESPTGYLKWKEQIYDKLMIWGYGDLLSRSRNQPTQRLPRNAVPAADGQPALPAISEADAESDVAFNTRLQDWES